MNQKGLSGKVFINIIFCVQVLVFNVKVLKANDKATRKLRKNPQQYNILLAMSHQPADFVSEGN